MMVDIEEDDVNLLVAEVLAACADAGSSGQKASEAFHLLNDLHDRIHAACLEGAGGAALRKVQPTVERMLCNILFGQFNNQSPSLLSPAFARLLADMFVTLFNLGNNRNLLAVAGDMLDHLGSGVVGSAASGLPIGLGGMSLGVGIGGIGIGGGSSKASAQVRPQTSQGKAAIFLCLGELLSGGEPLEAGGVSLGRRLSGHFPEVVTITLKLLRLSGGGNPPPGASPTGPAEHAMLAAGVRAVAKGLSGAGSISPATLLEAGKVASKAMTEKAPPVREASAQILGALASQSKGFTLVSLDALVTTAQRGVEDHVLMVRRASSIALSSILTLSVELSEAAEREASKSKNEGGDEPAPQGGNEQGAKATGGGAGTSGGPQSGSAKENEPSSKSASQSGSAGPKNRFSAMASKSAASLRKAGMANMRLRGAVGSPSSTLQRFGFGSVALSGMMGSTTKKQQVPQSFSLQSALAYLVGSFESWSIPSTAATPAAAMSPGGSGAAGLAGGDRLRSNEVRTAYVETAVEFLRALQRDLSGNHTRETLTEAGLNFAIAICSTYGPDDADNAADKTKRIDSKSGSLPPPGDCYTQDASFRRAAASYLFGSAFTSLSTEAGKLELCRLLLEACVASESESSANKAAETGVNGVKRRSSSAAFGGGLANMRPLFRFSGTFISAALSEVACTMSTLADASLALTEELDFQKLLPLLEHRDASVRQEASNLLYVCAITQPGYASRGVMPLLQLIGLYQAEVAVALAPGAPSGAALMLGGDGDSERTLGSIEGLVHALCAFVCASSANGRPKSSIAEEFVSQENLDLPSECYAAAAQHFATQQHKRSVAVPGGSSALQSGDLKTIPGNTSLALLGYAKSMISRQHDRAMTADANARVASSGWALVGALVTLGPAWCSENLNQLFPAWQSSTDEAEAALLKLASATATNRVASDPELLCSLRCLKASIVALATFVRCNQLLLEDMPAVARAVVQVLVQILQATSVDPARLPHRSVFAALHGALFEIACWLPRRELRLHRDTVAEPLHRLACGYALSGKTPFAQDEPNSLLAVDAPGVLSEEDAILATSTPEMDSKGSRRFGLPRALSRRNWRFESSSPSSRRFELLMEAVYLDEEEQRDSAMQLMAVLSCNASSQRVAVLGRDTAGSVAKSAADSFMASFGGSASEAHEKESSANDGEDSAHCVWPGDELPSEGMVLAPDPQVLTRVVDWANTFSAVHLAQISTNAQRDEIVQGFMGVLKRLTASAQASVLRNILAIFAAFLNQLAKAGVSLETKEAAWLSKAKFIMCVALPHHSTNIRLSAAYNLGMLARLAGSGFGYSVVNTLRKKLEGGGTNSPTPGSGVTAPNEQGGGDGNGDGTDNGKRESDKASSPQTSVYLKAGVALAYATIRREADMHDTRYLKINVVYDLCKLTSQPIRTWALHAWHTMVDGVGADVAKYVQPSMALINAHLLAVDGHPDRGGYGAMRATLGTFTCLARLANTLIAGLGPELSRPEYKAERFLNVWESLRRLGDFCDLQVECIKLVQQILLFQPALVMDNESKRRAVKGYLHKQVLRLGPEDGNKVKVAALDAFYLYSERSIAQGNTKSKISASVQWGSLALSAYELSYRTTLVQDWVIPPQSSAGQGAYILRRSVLPNRSKDPLLAHQSALLQGGDSAAAAAAAAAFSTGGQGLDEPVVQLAWSWNDLSRVRWASHTILAKLMGLCQRDVASSGKGLFVKASPTDSGASAEETARLLKSAGNLDNLECMTEWMHLFRGVTTGGIGSVNVLELEEEEDSDDDSDGGHSDAGMDQNKDNESKNVSEGEGSGANAVQRDGDSEINDLEALQLEQFCRSVLGKCGWETKILSVEGMIEVLDMASAFQVHRDVIFANQTMSELAKLDADNAVHISNSDPSSRKQPFVCMYLAELLTSSSQAANGQIQGAEVPQLSILGYCALVKVVRMFALCKDPHMQEDSILKQHEMQLTATLGPGLAPHASPLVLPYVSVLAVELVVAGVSSSVNRVVGLLLPPQLRESDSDDEDDDDEDFDDQDDARDQQQYPPSVHIESLLVRLTAMARLWLFSSSVNILPQSPAATAALSVAAFAAATESSTEGKEKEKKSKRRDKKAKGQSIFNGGPGAAIEKAMSKLLVPTAGVSGPMPLVRAWVQAVRDLSVLICPLSSPFAKLKHGCLEIAETEDGYVLFPVYLDSFWAISSALLTLPSEIGALSAADTDALLLATARVATCIAPSCTATPLSCLLFSAGRLLKLGASKKSSFSREEQAPSAGVPHDVLIAIVRVFVSVIDRATKIQSKPELVNTAQQALEVVSQVLLRSKGLRAQLLDSNTDCDFAAWHLIVEMAMGPLHKSLGLPSRAALLDTSGDITALNKAVASQQQHPGVAKLAPLEPAAVRLMGQIVKFCPQECATGYLPPITLALLTALATSRNEATIGAAKSVLLEVEGASREAVFAEAAHQANQAILVFASTEVSMPKLEALRLVAWIQVAWTIACMGQASDVEGKKTDEATNVVTELLRSCIRSRNLRACGLSFIRHLAKLGDTAPYSLISSSSGPAMVADLGPLIAASLLKSSGPSDESSEAVEDEDAAAAASLLTDLSPLFPSLVQFTLLSCLSMACTEGEGAYSSETRAVARKCLVALAQNCAEQVKIIVGSLPQQAATQLQGAIRASLEASA